MFDNEPEDIFAKTEVPPNLPMGGPAPRPPSPPTPEPSVGAPLVPPPPAPTVAPGPSRPMMPPPAVVGAGSSGPRKGVLKAILVFVVVAAIIGVAAILTYMLLFRKSAPAPSANTADTQTTNPSTDSGSSTKTNSQKSDAAKAVTPTPEATPKIVDSDGDGLSDAQEMEIGTDVDVADTDADGLSDREEVQVYSTNPLRPDTDGDSYLDGAEVSNGYNPNGDGKLFKVPSN